MNSDKPSPEMLKRAILELNHPVVLRNVINDNENWNFLSLENLKRILGEKQLNFRVGKNSKTPKPQWDLNCTIESMTFLEFLETLNQNDKKSWYYFDYKYMHEWFSEKPEILSAVDWRPFGFNKSGDESTFWIGSQGAHTNCHQDAYGCNLVAQIHGKKQWLLFPPGAGVSLQETRIPYEESTIYSKYNFFSPSEREEDELKMIDETPIHVVLEPGEVLFVPKGWWHFVESLDISISVNLWLQLDSDHETRLKEALVKLIVKKIGQNLPAVEENSYSTEELIKMIQRCKEGCKILQNKPESDLKGQTCKKMKKTPWNAEDFSQKYANFVKKLDHLSRQDFVTFLRNQRERFPEDVNSELTNKSSEPENSCQSVLSSVVEAFCRSDVIGNVAEFILQRKFD